MKMLYQCVNDKQWMIKLVDGKFLVGSLNRRTGGFKPICSCEFYYQAYLIIEALKDFMSPRKYFYKGVDLCPEATASFLKLTAKTDLLG